MKLIDHIRQQEQKTALDQLYDLRKLAKEKGRGAYIANGRLYVWCNDKYEEVTKKEELDQCA